MDQAEQTFADRGIRYASIRAAEAALTRRLVGRYRSALEFRAGDAVVDGVDHAGMVVDEQGAAVTTRAVLDVVASIRDARPLTG